VRALLLLAAVAACALATAAVGVVAGRRAQTEPPALNPNVVSSIWSVPVAGGRPRLVLRDRRHQDAFPAARPDGSILFVRPTSIATTALFAVRSGQAPRRLRSLPDFAPLAYSPARDELALADGSTLFAETPNPYRNELVVVRGGRSHAIPVEGSAGGLALAPHGDRLLFAIGRRLYLLHLGSGERRVVAPDGGSAAWSPDGRTIALGDAHGLRTLDLATGRGRRIAWRGAYASFSADGATLVYVTLKLAQSMPK
jgi:hypothetical protein